MFNYLIFFIQEHIFEQVKPVNIVYEMALVV